MGKSSSSSPDYSGVQMAQASADNAKLSYQLGQDQLATYKQQYADLAPQLQGIMSADIAGQTQANDLAKQQNDLYTSTYLPEEKQYAQDVQDYGSAANQAANAQSAMGAVAEQYNGARTAAEKQLEGFGVDPTSTRYASLDLGARTQEAAVAAGAGTKAIRDTVNTGLALQANDIGIGRGVVNSVNSGLGTGASVGSAGAGVGTSGLSTEAAALGTPTSFFNSGAANMGAYTGAVNGYNQAQMQAAQISAQQSTGTGSALGGIFGALMPSNGIMGLAEGGPTGGSPQVTPQGNGPQPVNGGAIPTEASPTGGKAIDDVPARLTAGEFVIPKDAVKWLGEKHFYSLIDKARAEKEDAHNNSGVGPEYHQAIPERPAFVSQSR